MRSKLCIILLLLVSIVSGQIYTLQSAGAASTAQVAITVSVRPAAIAAYNPSSQEKAIAKVSETFLEVLSHRKSLPFFHRGCHTL